MPHPPAGASRSVFSKVFSPLLALLVMEAFLLLSVLFIGRVPQQLDQNAEDLLGQQVETRSNYLESAMVGTWGDLTPLARTVNAQAQAMLDSGALSLEELDSNSDACAPLLLAVMDDLISAMRAKSVSGLYLIFNTGPLDGHVSGSRTGLYLRDLDPAAAPSPSNEDLLLERAPIAVVKRLNISTDTQWTPQFSFPGGTGANYDYLLLPFQSAWEAGGAADAADFGCWTAAPALTGGSASPALSYSIPLILPDGTVYGVLGIDLLPSYLTQLLPAEELFDDRQGTYLLAVSTDGQQLSPVLCSGSGPAGGLPETLSLSDAENGPLTLPSGQRCFAALRPLTLYSSNTPFLSTQWYLVGLVPTDALYAFSRHIMSLFYLSLLLTLAGGLLGSLFISRRFAKPIRRLSAEVEQAQRDRRDIPALSPTGIREIDRFSAAITGLSQDVVTASTRFLRILDMASAELAGFEVRTGEEHVYVTDNFFPMLGLPHVDPVGLTAQEFARQFARADRQLSHTADADGSRVYQVPTADGGVRYVRVQISASEERRVGLAEDVTRATQERLRIEHDRDYDLLTGLLNRRAFYRMAEALFQTPDVLGHAALVMMDLDNLKAINDRFGHDWGDQYIRLASGCFTNHAAQSALCARVSGDEFYLLFYGCSSQAELRDAICQLERAIRRAVLHLPDGESISIRVSGGITWYPGDSRDFWELMKFADFAMYQVKRSGKGRLGVFDPSVYAKESILAQSRREFAQLLERRAVGFHFQPIFDAATGRCLAYEALMRADLPTLRSPETILRIARETGRLQAVEGLTWLCAPGAFETLLHQGLVEEDALLFVNSIASHHMTPEDEAECLRRYGHLRRRFVVEITESEDLSQESIRAKQRASGDIPLRYALDDYGSGYNSEKNLLELAPQFIKVDRSIIQGLDGRADKRQILSNTVQYAHSHGMSVVAEGVETAEELQAALESGVDLLQGFFLARPAAVPPPIAPQALAIIRAHRPTGGETPPRRA